MTWQDDIATVREQLRHLGRLLVVARMLDQAGPPVTAPTGGGVIT